MNSTLLYLKTYFGSEYLKLKGVEHNNDKQLYINIYEMIEESILEAQKMGYENIQSPLLRSGINKEINRKIDELELLEKSLKERNMI